MYDLCPYFTNDGTVGLFSSSDDDIYHSTYGALSESWQKFILPSHLEEYLMNHESVKILDICYGIGYNTKTALNIFIKNSLKNKKKSKIVFPFDINYAAIDADNIISKKEVQKYLNQNISIEKNNISNQEVVHEQTSSIGSIDADNIQVFEIDKKQSFAKQPELFCTNILIDAVDVDSVLINLSPFITRGQKNNFYLRKYMNNKYVIYKSSNDKLAQVRKISKSKIYPLPKEYKIQKEVQMILLKSLIDQNSNILNDKILGSLLIQKKFAPFYDNFTLNFAKFYLNLRYKTIKPLVKLPFLHNIYYRYISKSYKNMKKLLENNKIDISFHNNDARNFILATENKYNFMFLDAFTPAKCPTLWTIQFFRELYSKLEDDGMILTYSSSAAIRNAFLQNGFCVGKIFDYKTNKFIGTIATKNKNLIEYSLDECDLALINSKAGICFQDENLSLDNSTIIKNREQEILNSNLVSSTKVLKGYKNG